MTVTDDTLTSERVVVTCTEAHLQMLPVISLHHLSLSSPEP